MGPRPGVAGHRLDDGLGDVAGKNRLKPRMPTADQRQRRREPCERREAVEEIVIGPEHD